MSLNIGDDTRIQKLTHRFLCELLLAVIPLIITVLTLENIIIGLGSKGARKFKLGNQEISKTLLSS